MHILFETRIGYTFTHTSPNDVQIKRPGASPLTIHSPKTPEAVDRFHRSLSFACSLDVEALGEVRSSLRGSSAPVHRRSLRRRICHFFEHLVRSHPEKMYCQFYQHEDRLPRTQSTMTRREFESSAPYGQSSVMHEIDGNNCYELGEQTPLASEDGNFQLDASYLNHDHMIPKHNEHISKEVRPTLEYAPQHSLAARQTPLFRSLTLKTEPDALMNPGLISSSHSHESLTESPVTPDSTTQPQRRSDFHDNEISPLEIVSPTMGEYDEHSTPYDTPKDSLHSSFDSATTRYSRETFDVFAQSKQSDTARSHQHLNTSCSSECSRIGHVQKPYQYNDQCLLAAQPNYATAYAPYTVPTNLGCRTQVNNANSRWYPESIPNPGMITDYARDQIPQEVISQEIYRPTDVPPRVVRESRSQIQGALIGEEPPQYAPMICDECKQSFTGKYRKGNLQRHIRDFHSAVQSLVGKTCRICKLVYKRADNARKHEWLKHGYAESPSSRRRK